jgi:hypothetical protein
MPHDKEEQQPPPADQQDELAEARTLLQDPAQVAPVDTKNFGKRFVEILTRALRRDRRKVAT